MQTPTTSNSSFTWIGFYEELANILQPYKESLPSLISKIREIYRKTGIRFPTLERNGELRDIDPFTVFGLFNKGISNATRMTLLEGIAEVFGITSEIPRNFDGIPVLNNWAPHFITLRGTGAHRISNICGSFLMRRFVLQRKILWKTGAVSVSVSIRSSPRRESSGISPWGFTGSGRTVLSAWIPEVAGIWRTRKMCRKNLSVGYFPGRPQCQPQNGIWKSVIPAGKCWRMSSIHTIPSLSCPVPPGLNQNGRTSGKKIIPTAPGFQKHPLRISR